MQLYVHVDVITFWTVALKALPPTQTVRCQVDEQTQVCWDYELRSQSLGDRRGSKNVASDKLIRLKRYRRKKWRVKMKAALSLVMSISLLIMPPIRYSCGVFRNQEMAMSQWVITCGICNHLCQRINTSWWPGNRRVVSRLFSSSTCYHKMEYYKTSQTTYTKSTYLLPSPAATSMSSAYCSSVSLISSPCIFRYSYISFLTFF